MKGKLFKYAEGAELPILDIKPSESLISRATTSDPGLAERDNSDRRFLDIYNTAQRDGLLFEGNEGDRFGMRYLGVRPSGFDISSDTADGVNRFLKPRPVLKKKLNIDGSVDNMEKSLFEASDPNSNNHKAYQRLINRTNILSSSGIPSPSIEGRIEVGKRIDAAQQALDFTDRSFHARGTSHWDSDLQFTDYDKLTDSGRTVDGTIVMGLSPEENVRYGRRFVATHGSTAAHEGGHSASDYNTNMTKTGDVYTDQEMRDIFKESPVYGNIYSNIPDSQKRLLKHKWWKFPNRHDREYSEGFSDLVETRHNMHTLGISDAAITPNEMYTRDNVRDYLKTDMGRGDRFIRLRGGRRGKWLDKTVDALNSVYGL